MENLGCSSKSLRFDIEEVTSIRAIRGCWRMPGVGHPAAAAADSFVVHALPP
jgi:hypothetical protein